MLTLIILLLILLVLFGGGWWGTPRYGPYVGFSPFFAILILLLCLWAIGVIHF